MCVAALLGVRKRPNCKALGQLPHERLSFSRGTGSLHCCYAVFRGLLFTVTGDSPAPATAFQEKASTMQTVTRLCVALPLALLLIACLSVARAAEEEEAKEEPGNEGDDSFSRSLRWEGRREEELEEEHQQDSLSLLLVVFLLGLVVITVWIFKMKRFRILHETGFSLIYGKLSTKIRHFQVSKQKPTGTGTKERGCCRGAELVSGARVKLAKFMNQKLKGKVTNGHHRESRSSCSLDFGGNLIIRGHLTCHRVQRACRGDCP